MENNNKPLKLTRADLIEHLVEKFRIKQKTANQIIELILEDIKKALINNQIVELRSFGTFEIHKRKSRKARNPKSGQILIAAPKKKVFFRPGQELKLAFSKEADKSITQINSEKAE